jgi:ATP-dependent Clp protease, protease subunit
MLEPKGVAIRFMATVDGNSVGALLSTVDQKLKQGVKEFTLLLSTPGGTVFHGLSAYNFLRGIPAKVVTHNFGSVDSIGVVIYCAGSERRSVPHARFLLHGVSAGFQQNERLEEKQLEERLKGLQIDLRNIGRVIAAHSGKSESEVYQAMLDRTTLDPDEARKWGLVQTIQAELVQEGQEIVAIQ